MAGVCYACLRFSGSLGMLHFTSRYDGGVHLAYLGISYRFGKVKPR